MIIYPNYTPVIFRDSLVPRYFFDFYDGGVLTADDEGQEMVDLATARREASSVLPEIARDLMADGNEHTITAVLRTEEGAILRATLSLKLEHLN